MNANLVTIIIPIYNATDRLEYAIKSVLEQSYKNIELVLVNDGSIDHSLSICLSYAKLDARIKVINQNNAGVSAARNRGLKEASGEFIMFLDADDTIDPETIHELIHRLNIDKSDMVIFGMSFDYYQGSVFKYKKELSFKESMTVSSNEIKEVFFRMYDANYLSSACNKIFNHEIIRKNRIAFDEQMAILEDFKFVLDFMEQSKTTTVVPDVYYHYYNNVLSSILRRRPNIDYMRNFKILDDKLREFSRNIGLRTEDSSGKINGMIFRYYMIAIEKLFIEDQEYKGKCEQLKRFMLDKDFNRAVDKAKPKGTKLRVIRCLFKRKSVRLLSLIFWLNSWRS